MIRSAESSRLRGVAVNVAQADGVLDIDAWVDMYVRMVLQLEGVPLSPAEPMKQRHMETNLAS